MDIFNNENYKVISNLVEQKISVLKENKDFNKKYKRLTDLMEEFEKTLSIEQKEQFNEIVQLFYKTE